MPRARLRSVHPGDRRRLCGPRQATTGCGPTSIVFSAFAARHRPDGAQGLRSRLSSFRVRRVFRRHSGLGRAPGSAGRSATILSRFAAVAWAERRSHPRRQAAAAWMTGAESRRTWPCPTCNSTKVQSGSAGLASREVPTHARRRQSVALGIHPHELRVRSWQRLSPPTPAVGTIRLPAWVASHPQAPGKVGIV